MTAGLVILDPRKRPRVPWANGRGMTRELIRDPDGKWRLSVADLEQDAPFSAFPGVDRLFILVAGRVRLTVGGRETELVAGDAARFRGEDAVDVALDRPARAVNLMSARGAIAVDSQRQPAARQIASPATPEEILVLASPGRTAAGVWIPAGAALITEHRSRGDGDQVEFMDPVCVHRLRMRRLDLTTS